MILDVNPGSGSGFLPIPDPDPGVKKAQDPGSRITIRITDHNEKFSGTDLRSM
jgi:hypothetical protein